MKKIVKKVITAVVCGIILVLTGVCAYAGLTAHVGMTDELGDKAGHDLFRKYYERGISVLKR